MAKQTKKSNLEKAEQAAKVVKKAAPPKSVRKKIYKKSGIAKALPYLSVLFGIILAICFITVNLFDAEDGAGVVGYYINLFFCGLLGGGAFLLPAMFCFVGVVGCAFSIRWRQGPRNEDEEAQMRISHRTKNVRVVLSYIFVLLFSALLGVFSADGSFDLLDLWEAGAESFTSGGIIGGSLGFLLYFAFKTIISAVILIIGLIVVLLFILGITPDYIATRIRCSREVNDSDIDLDDKKYEQMRIRELEKAKKRKQKQLEAQKRRELRQLEEEEEPVLIPPTPAPKKQKVQRAVEEAPAAMSDDELDKFTDSLGEDEAPENFDDPEPTPLTLDQKESDHGAETAADYGGDPTIDGESFTVEELLADLGGQKEQAATPEVPLTLGEITKETLAEDLTDVLPDEGEEEYVQEEIVLPYVFPPVDMLAPNQNPIDTDCQAELRENARLLKETLKSFKVEIREINYSRGPTITRYELKPEVGTRVRSIANLVDDISLSLATSGVRIEAPIPNKAAVGIEVPNRNRATVYLRDLIENQKFTDAKSKLTSCLGMDVGGNPIYFDISKMPHLLIAGATGMGKSVCINSIIISLLYKARPDDVKLILIDPKKVEFNIYKDIPHLYAPIVSEPKKAAGALASAVAEMERRFELIEEVGVRDIGTYNAVTESDPEKERMPHMVIIIDELADLMMTAPDEVESCICRLAQKARAAGIHIVIGTQRPSVDVITGLIKANIPSRIACTVASQVDSRTIIDIAGAEKLIGRGDMLFAPVGAAKPMRVQGAFVSEAEVENIVTFIKQNNSAAKYNSDFISSMEENAKMCGMSKKAAAAMAADADSSSESEGGDSKFRDAVKLAIEEGKISTSLMQRRLGVGYGRAAKIIDTMEQMGYVSKPDGNKPRRVLITMEEYMNRVSDGNLGEE